MSSAIIKKNYDTFNVSEEELEKCKKTIKELQNEGNINKLITAGEMNLDQEKTILFYNAAIELGSSRAMLKLANLYEKLAMKRIHENVQFLKKAFELYQKAASLNEIDAISRLAKAYYEGVNISTNKIIEQDLKKAFSLYEHLSKLGSLKGNEMLAFMYRNGIGVEKDSIKAYEQYKYLVQCGNLDAINTLALMTSIGEGTNQNCAEAYAMLKSKELIEKSAALKLKK